MASIVWGLAASQVSPPLLLRLFSNPCSWPETPDIDLCKLLFDSFILHLILACSPAHLLLSPLLGPMRTCLLKPLNTPAAPFL